MRTLAATHPQQLFWLLLSQCHLSVAPREMTALLTLELTLCCSNVTYRQPGDIRQRCSLYRCSLHCESIPKLAALQPPWPRKQFGILRKLFEMLY